MGTCHRGRSAHRAAGTRLPRERARGGARPCDRHGLTARMPVRRRGLSTGSRQSRHPLAPSWKDDPGAGRGTRHDRAIQEIHRADRARGLRLEESSRWTGRRGVGPARRTGRHRRAAHGAGKSAIYQLAGTLLDGITLVVSPLIALQRDQLNQLEEAPKAPGGVAINSTLGDRATEDAWSRLETRDARFVFVAPEQLAKDDVVRRLGVSASGCSRWTRRTASPAGGTTSDRITCGWAMCGLGSDVR